MRQISCPCQESSPGHPARRYTDRAIPAHLIYSLVTRKLAFMFNYAPRHEDVWRNSGITQRIHNADTIYRWVVTFTLWPLYSEGNNPRYSPRYPLDNRLGEPQSRSGRCWDKIFICRCRVLNLSSTAVQLVASYNTDLSAVVTRNFWVFDFNFLIKFLWLI
jgi:hypothetical protein